VRARGISRRVAHANEPHVMLRSASRLAPVARRGEISGGPTTTNESRRSAKAHDQPLMSASVAGRRSRHQPGEFDADPPLRRFDATPTMTSIWRYPTTWQLRPSGMQPAVGAPVARGKRKPRLFERGDRLDGMGRDFRAQQHACSRARLSFYTPGRSVFSASRQRLAPSLRPRVARSARQDRWLSAHAT
jgi:hypothetical protein